MPGFLIDLDGTLYRGTERVEYAAEFIELLAEKRYPYFFLTNNSSRTPDKVAEHLQHMGIRADAHEVITTAQAAAAYIAGRNEGKRVYYVGEHGLEKALLDAGLTVVEDEPDYVVQGIDRQLTYDKLCQAVQFIMAGAVSVLTNPDLQLPTEKGLFPGAGSIAAAIQAGSGKEPVLIGKPSRIIMDYAIGRLELPSSEIWVVGDNLRTDIAGALASQCRSALILTGVTTRGNMEELIRETGVKPELVADHLLDFAGRL
jgi:4-nitrophenyl phosphatase